MMSKKWLISLVIGVILLSVLVFFTPALASGRPVFTAAENSPGPDQVINPDDSNVDQAIPQIDLPSGDYNIFLKIDGVVGESTDRNHKDWLELLSFNWGLSTTATTSGAGASAARVQAMDFCFSHILDKASPKLMSSCAMGQHIKQAVLELWRPGEKGIKFYQLTLTEVIVTKVYLSGDTALPTTGTSTNQVLLLQKPAEDVVLTFAKIEWTYWSQKADGSIGGAISGSLDLKSNRAQ